MGNTVYLSPSGNDANTYLQAQNPATPWATPGQVQTGAVSGDTVSLAAGTYTFASITFTKGFTWNGAALSNGAPTTIIDGASAAAQWALASSFNYTFTNIKFSNILNTVANTPAFSWAGSGTIIFTNCIFQNVQNTASVIGACLAGYGVSGAGTATLTACLFVNCYSQTSDAGQAAIDYEGTGGTPTLTMNGCVFAWTTQTNITAAIFRIYTPGAVTLKNCIFYNGTANTYRFATVGSNLTPTITYSCVYSWTNAPTGTGVITSDPLMIDAANANFNLRPTSPCLSSGTL